MPLEWFKSLFSTKSSEPTESDYLWSAMEKMDPLCSYERFRKLKLTDEERPILKKLIEGSMKPAEIDAVREWAAQRNENPNGIDALLHALQHVLEEPQILYLFEKGNNVPAARLPLYENESEITVLFNERECHLQLVSVEEFVKLNQIEQFSLEPLDLDDLYNRMTGRPAGTPRRKQERQLSLTFERKTEADEKVSPPVGADDIAAELTELGYAATPAAVELEAPLDKLGMFSVQVEFEPGSPKKVIVWVVPAAELNDS